MTPSPGPSPFSDRSDSSANDRNLESWWSTEFSEVWDYTPLVLVSMAERQRQEQAVKHEAAVATAVPAPQGACRDVSRLTSRKLTPVPNER